MMESLQKGDSFRSLFANSGVLHKWSIPSAIQLACVLEATAPKLGNVHPGRAFKDMNYDHFLLSAIAIRQAFESVAEQSIGQLVLGAVRATRNAIAVNTNLGMILLFAPLAKAHRIVAPDSYESWRAEVRRQLTSLTHEDSRCVYQAIQLARPGGIGDVPQNDVRHDAPSDLIAAMHQVATFDAVARQYTNDFEDIFCTLVPWLNQALDQGRDTFDAICEIQLRWMGREPDGLIVRKAGIEIATRIQNMAAEVLLLGDLGQSQQKLVDLDRFLSGEGNRFNPGTTADLIAATLFVRLLSGPL